MESNDTLIKKMFNSLLITNIISMVLSVACTVIASIIAGNFLEADAVAAFGLVHPIVLLINTIGMLLGPGLGIMVTRYMGKAEQKRIDQVFSIVIYANIILFLLLSVALYVTAPSIALALGKKAGNNVVALTTDYLRGYSLGLVPMRISMVLLSVIIIDNNKKQAINGMVLNLISNLALDLVNVLVLNWGMYGMALASTTSYILLMLYLLTHFTRKNRILHFTFSGLKLGDIKDVMFCGIPNVINFGGQALRGFAFNAVLLIISGGTAVASMLVCNSVFSLVISVLSGILVSTAVLSSMLYGEEDRGGLKQTLIVSMKTVYLLMMVLMTLAIIFAKPIADVFMKKDSPEILVQAARFIRVYAVLLFLASGSYSLSGIWQGTNKLGLNNFLSILREFVIPVLSSCVLGLAFGLKGFELGFIVAGVLIVIVCYAINSIINKKLFVKAEDMLMLDDNFRIRYRERLEMSLSTTDEAIEASKKVMNFCLERWANKKEAARYALFVEEIACNTIKHGFKDTKQGSIDVRVIYRNSNKIIRFRDNGKPFDPVKWFKQNHPEDPLRGAGIRIVVGMAKEVRYIPAMGLNNLLVIL